MAKYTLINGEVLTDEDLEREALEFENGTWKGELRDYRWGPGRPPLSGEGTVMLSFRAPANEVDAFELKALQNGETKSQAMRTAMNLYLEA